MARLLVALTSALLLLTGCSPDGATELASVTSPDAEHFAGLDPGLVEEAMAHPHSSEALGEETSDAGRESLAQGIVRNFAVCRDAFEVYTRWVTTGDPGSLAPLPMPDSPREPSHTVWGREYAQFEDAATSGDPEQLRFRLTANGSCGQWIPARPNDVSGPTIADAIEAGL
jgi:hypothetical protein